MSTELRAFIDSNIYIYSCGREHEMQEPCQGILYAINDREIIAESSVEMVHEALQYWRKKMPLDEALTLASDIGDATTLHEFNQQDLKETQKILATYTHLDIRDAIFVATANRIGIDKIISADRDFDTIEGLERIDPRDFKSVAAS